MDIDFLKNIWGLVSGACVTIILIFYKGLWKIVSEFSVAQNDINHLKESQKEVKLDIREIRADISKIRVSTIRTTHEG